MKQFINWLVLSFCVVASFYFISSAEAIEPQIVKIGLIYPLTGPMASFGEDMAKAVPLLEKKFNSEQSKYKFVLTIEDGKFGHTNAAITAAKKLIEIDGIQFLVVGSSGEILQIAPYTESVKVLCVTGFASHPDVKKAGNYVFRTYIDAERGIRIVVDDMIKKEYARVAVLTEESSFTSAIRDALQKYLGDRLVMSENYTFGDADFATLLAKARSKKPQAYYLNTATPASFITLVKQLKDQGVTEPIYTYYTPSLKEVQESLGEKLKGTIYLDYPDISQVSEDFKKFLLEFEAEKDNMVRAPFNFRTNYNAIKVVYDAIMNVGPDATKVKDYLYQYDQPSATGRLKFDNNGDVEDLNLALKTY